MHRRINSGAVTVGRITAWIRKDYPKDAPEHGHNYLMALCASR